MSKVESHDDDSLFSVDPRGFKDRPVAPQYNDHIGFFFRQSNVLMMFRNVRTKQGGPFWRTVIVFPIKDNKTFFHILIIAFVVRNSILPV